MKYKGKEYIKVRTRGCDYIAKQGDFFYCQLWSGEYIEYIMLEMSEGISRNDYMNTYDTNVIGVYRLKTPKFQQKMENNTVIQNEKVEDFKIGAIYYDKLKHNVVKLVDFTGSGNRACLVVAINDCYITPKFMLQIANAAHIEHYKQGRNL